jgi:hypothetical protein
MIDLRKGPIFSFPPEGLYLLWLWYKFCQWRWQTKLGYAELALEDFYKSREHRDLGWEDLQAVKERFEFRVNKASSELARYKRHLATLTLVFERRGLGSWVVEA